MTENAMKPEPGRVLGIGGVFLKSPDHARLQSWYEANLGLRNDPSAGIMLHWRSDENPDERHMTVWSAFADTSKYFDPSKAPFMINYIVDDIDAMLARLKAAGATIDDKREDHDYGRFAWAYDCDGNKIELWEPPKANPSDDTAGQKT